MSALTRTITILRSSHRSHPDLEYLSTQLPLLIDLRQYLFDLNDAKKMRLMSQVKLEEYEEGQVVFHKGDPSKKLYVILTGKLDMLDGDGRAWVHIATLGPGKMIGERGLVRKSPRMLTAKANVKTMLITLEEAPFRALLETAVFHRLDEKLKFIERYLPNTKSQSTILKERLVYAFNMHFYRRGQVLIAQGDLADSIFFMYSGECTVIEKHGQLQRKVVKLATGSWAGEESVLLGRRCAYSVIVSSEDAWIYELARGNALKLLSEATVEAMKAQFAVKHVSRKLLAEKVITFTPSCSPDLEIDTRFHLASPIARRRLAVHPKTLLRQLRNLHDQRSDELRIELNDHREIGPIPVRSVGVKSEASSPRSYASGLDIGRKLRPGMISERRFARRIQF